MGTSGTLVPHVSLQGEFDFPVEKCILCSGFYKYFKFELSLCAAAGNVHRL